nr:hypothetical protein [Tanacetum cinerariifolium]
MKLQLIGYTACESVVLGKVDSRKALDAILVVTKCSGTKSDKHNTSNDSGNYITHAVDVDMRPVNDQVPFAEVDSNTTPDSTNMSHKGGDIDQDDKQYQVKSSLLNAKLFKTKEMIEKETLGLVPNQVPATLYVPPNNKDLEILFKPMFDEYFEPPRVKRPIPSAPVVVVPVISTGTSLSTTIAQDAPSTSYSPSSAEVQAPVLHQGVAAGPTFKDEPLTDAVNIPFANPFAHELSFEDSS